MAGHYRIDVFPDEAIRPLSDRGENTAAFKDPAVRVWSDTPVIRLGDQGCIVGYLFSRTGSNNRVTKLDGNAVEAIQASKGRSLLADFWGAYVAILTGENGTVSVLRDPSALLPCYYRSESDRLILADDVVELGKRGHGAVDFLEIGRLLMSQDAMGRSTCLTGIAELLAGECITRSSAGTVINALWSPWDWTSPARPVEFEAAASRLRSALLDCVGSWTSCFGSILLGVSGGLDSSIVACGARQRPSTLHCLNLVSNGPGGDERGYATALTSSLGLPLHERHFDLSAIDVEQPVAPNHPRPNAPHFMQYIAAAHSVFRNHHRVDAYFSGNGGDNVFCSLQTAAPFVDRFLTQGSRSGIMNTLSDLSLLTGADGMTILRHAWDIYRRVGDPSRVRCDMSGLALPFTEMLEPHRSLHPWLELPTGALPGKTGHIKQLARAHRSIELYPRKTHPVHIAPLMSQPIVEAALAIPTWQWIHGGVNRAVAREAVRGFVPDELLKRTSKGGPTGFTIEIYQAQGAKAQEMLRDGLLARAGMLDLSIFEGADPLTVEGSDRARRILALCAAESWVRWWSDAI